MTTQPYLVTTDQGATAPAHPTTTRTVDVSDIADLVRRFASTGTPGSAPSRRANKNRSGRRAVKQYHSQQWEAAVGGYKNPMRAIYAPADQALCKTYEDWKGQS